MRMLLLFFCVSLSACAETLFEADHSYFQYTGRIDFTNKKAPRYWAAGASVQARFRGATCRILITDEVLHGTTHNYLEVSIDGAEPVRIKLKEKENTIDLGQGLSTGEHTITILKATESIMGFVEFKGLICDKLLSPTEKPKRKIEFFGDSITSGMGSELSPIPCDSGEWYDQHTAWYGYAATTARGLNAQYHLTSESGIGMIHNCCDKPFLMPQVYDKMNLNQDKVAWDFSRYQPDVVSICLGQNDGIQDSVLFTTAYVQFVKKLRSHYPKATIVCLTSPMADAKLRAALTNYLKSVVTQRQAASDANIDYFVFDKSYNHGCTWHPDKADQQAIAEQLTAFLRKKMNW